MDSYEFLKYLTVNMKGYENAENAKEYKVRTATGFYAVLNIASCDTPVIITAKHFASKASKVTLMLHYKNGDSVVTIPVTMPVKWNFSEDSDLAYCELKPIQEKFNKITKKQMFYTALAEKNILTEEEIKEIRVLTEVVMIGYPSGEGSTHHYYPLFKKGYLASLPKDATEDSEAYIDMSAIGGFSGSPILLNNSDLKLVGVLVSGITDESSQCSAMSLYVTSDKILDFK